MCANFVYKRRRFRNSVEVPLKQNTMENSKLHHNCDSCYNVGHEPCLPAVNNDAADRSTVAFIESSPSTDASSPKSLPTHLQNAITIDSQADRNLTVASTSKPYTVNGFPTAMERISTLASPDNSKRISAYSNSAVNESCSSSKSSREQRTTLTKVREDDTEECSSSVAKEVKQQGAATSTSDFCIKFLKSNGLIGGCWPTDKRFPLEVLGGDGTEYYRSCKICGLAENPRNMLICDLCEEAFHLQCSQTKDPHRENWYCRPCLTKKPRPLLDAVSGKVFRNISKEYKRKILQEELGPIHFMLVDTQPYKSAARIGEDFQADVLEWSGPVLEDTDKFGEPSILDPMECANMTWSTKSSKSSSIGNWIQCRELNFNGLDDNNEGVVCGKWRRAPLFVTQTDDWDCSCAVVWDPFHADCAVPQELETDEILKHLKYVELLRARLNKRKTPG